MPALELPAMRRFVVENDVELAPFGVEVVESSNVGSLMILI